MKTRLISEIKKHIILLVAGFIYYIWVITTKLYIPCIFRLLTGFKCPGCGITHMIVALCRFDFSTAYRENPLLFITLPVIISVYAINRIHYIIKGTKIKRTKVIRFTEYIFLVAILIFWILRNLPI